MTELFYRKHIFFCTNKRDADHPRGCCAGKGSLKLRNYMKLKIKELGLHNIRVNTSGCLDRCEEGPCIVIYPEGIWYRANNKTDIDSIIENHITSGKRVDDLEIKNK
mgnify:FL=1|tara:strand:- start:196 stop:516 length:321 start_codon:yes stop_codon:yes gene_type:complete